MATYYWVGGTGNTSDATNHWSTSSGGSPNVANVPTSSVDVVFDAASSTTAYTVTVDAPWACKNLTFSAAPSVSGTITLAGTQTLSVSGSILGLAGMLTSGYSGIVGLIGYSTAASPSTIDSKLSWTLPVTYTSGFYPAGGYVVYSGYWKFTSDFAAAGVGLYMNGVKGGSTLDTNSKTGYFPAAFIQDNASFTEPRTVKLGSSTIYTGSSGITILTTTLTLDAGTSTIHFGALYNRGSIIASVVPVTLYDAYIENTSLRDLMTGGSGTWTINATGGATFRNLTVSGPDTGGWDNRGGLLLLTDVTVTGTFTAASSSITNRLNIRSATIGTPKTITAAAVSLTDVTFKDITGAGAATWSGTRVGNALGNSEITFTAGATKYWVGNTNSAIAANVWALTSGGSGATANYPLPQDDVVFDANSFSADGQTVTFVGHIWKSTSFAGITKNITMSLAPNNGGIHELTGGNLTLSSRVTTSQNSGYPWHFTARSGTQTITMAGKILPGPLVIYATGATVELADAFLCADAITHYGGTFKDNGFSSSGTTFTTSNTFSWARTLNLTGTMTLSATGTVWVPTLTNLTVTALPIFKLTNTTTGNRTFNGNDLTYGGLWLASGPSASHNLFVTGNNTFGILKDDVNVLHSILFTGGGTTTVTGAFTVNGGTSRDTSAQLVANTGANFATLAPHTISAGSVTLGYVAFENIMPAGASIPWSGTRIAVWPSGLVNPTGKFTLASPRTLYWYAPVSGGLVSYDISADPPTHWYTGSGGTGTQATTVPNMQDTMVFDSGSITEASTTLTAAANATFRWGSITFAGVTNSPTFAPPSIFMVYGDFILGSPMTWSGTALTVLGLTGTLNLAGNTHGGALSINSQIGTTTLAGALTATGALNVGTGATFNDAGYSVTAASYAQIGTVYPTNSVLNKTGNWILSGTGTVVNIGTNATAPSVVNDTAGYIKLTSTANATRTFAGAGKTYNQLWISGAYAGRTNTITGANTYGSFIDDANVYHIVIFPAGTQTITGALTITGSSPLNSPSIIGTATTANTFVPDTLISAGSASLTNVIFKRIGARGASIPWSGANISVQSDRQLNQNITGTTPRTLYWYTPTAATYDVFAETVANWYTGSGGTGSLATVPPLYNDTLIFDANSIGQVGTTLDFPMPSTNSAFAVSYKSIDFTGVTNNPAITGSGSALVIQTSLTLSNNPTWTSLPPTYFSGDGVANNVATLTTNNVTFPAAITLRNDAGIFNLAGNLTATGAVTVSTGGIINDNGYSITAPSFVIGATTNLINQTINKSATWTATGTGTVVTGGKPTTTGVTLTINETAGSLKITDSSSAGKTFAGGGLTYGNVWYAPGAGTGTLTLTGSSTYNDLKDDGTAAHSILFTTGTTTVQTFSVTGGSAGALVTVNGDSPGTTFISVASGTMLLPYVTVQNLLAIGGATFAVVHGADNGGNTGWIFGKDYYWVGGSGNWSDATNHWATTSGGAPSVSNVPEQWDSVYWNAASNTTAYTVIVDGVAALNNVYDVVFSAAPSVSGTITLAGSVAMSIYGNWTFLTGMTTTYSGTITFRAVSGTKTITSNSVIWTNPITFNGAGGWILSDGLITTTLTLNNGTLNTNSKAVTTSVVTQVAGTLILGTSILNVAQFSVTGDASNSLASSTIIASSSASNTVVSSSGSSSTVALGAVTIYAPPGGGANGAFAFIGNFTATYLSILSASNPTSPGFVSVFGDITVTNTLKYLGLNQSFPLRIYSSITGTPRIITAATIDATSDYASFSDITAAGSSIPWTGTYIGDSFGNSNITFTPAMLLYLYVPTGGYTNLYTSPSYWYSNSGGTGSVARVPLPQDTIIVNAGSFAVANIIVGFQYLYIGDITFTGITNNPVVDFTLSYWHGNITFSSGMSTRRSGYGINDKIRSLKTLTSAGLAFGSNYQLDGPGGTRKLLDAFTNVGTTTSQNQGSITVSNGTFDTSGFSVTTDGRVSFAANTTINMAGSTFIIGGAGSAWIVQPTTTVSAAGSMIKLQPVNAGTSSGSFGGGGKTYGGLWCVGSGGAVLNITGENTFETFKDEITVGHQITLPIGTTTIQGLLTLIGSTQSNSIRVNGTVSTSDIPGDPICIISAGSVSLTNAQFIRIKASGSSIPWTGTNLSDVRLTPINQNITFDSARTLYWYTPSAGTYEVFAEPNTNWYTGTGGSGSLVSTPPRTQDNLIFNANSIGSVSTILNFVTGTGNATGPAAYYGNSMGASLTFSGVTNNPSTTATGSGATSRLFGSLTLDPGVTYTSFPSPLGLFGGGTSSTSTLTTNGVAFPGTLRLSPQNGTLTLVGNVTANTSIAIEYGTVVDAGYSISAPTITVGLTSATAQENLIVNKTGNWIITGTGNAFTFNQVNAATQTFNDTAGYIKFTDTSATQKTFAGGGQIYNNFWYSPGSGTGTLNITGSNTFNDFKDDGTADHSIKFTANTTTTVTSLSGFANNHVAWSSITAAPHTIVKAGDGTIEVHFKSISYSIASPTNTFGLVGTFNLGNNSGWLFTRIQSRLTATGTLLIRGIFDEVTGTSSGANSQLSDSSYAATEFDDYTINGGSVAMRQTNTGKILVSQLIDEFTGILV